MTLGWGAACTDGVVIATDSLVARYREWPNGGVDVWADLCNEKLVWVDERICYIPSGVFGGDHVMREYERGMSLVEAAPVIFDVLSPRSRPMLDGATREDLGANKDFDVLIGGGPIGDQPGLLLAQTSGRRGAADEWLRRIPVGSIVEMGAMGRAAIGVAKPDAVRHLRDDLTTEMALGLGIVSCHEYIRSCLRSWGGERLGDFPGALEHIAGELIPSVAFPLQVARITADQVDRYEVWLPGDVTDEDVAAAKQRAAAVIASGSANDRDGPKATA